MDGFIGEIRMFPYNFSNLEGWIACDGRTLPFNQYPALSALIGSTYGGDGRTTIGLPNLQSLVPVGLGTAPGGTANWTIGLKNTPEESVTLTTATVPSHTHTSVTAKTTPPANFATDMKPAPAGNAYLSRGVRKNSAASGGYENLTMYNAAMVTKGVLPDQTVSASCGVANGAAAAHENRQPYLGMGFFICVNGAWPPRS